MGSIEACGRDFAGEVREAMNKSPHVCARARVGERPVSSLMCEAAERERPDRQWHYRWHCWIGSLRMLMRGLGGVAAVLPLAYSRLGEPAGASTGLDGPRMEPISDWIRSFRWRGRGGAAAILSHATAARLTCALRRASLRVLRLTPLADFHGSVDQTFYNRYSRLGEAVEASTGFDGLELRLLSRGIIYSNVAGVENPPSRTATNAHRYSSVATEFFVHPMTGEPW
jgi:hypothetical protein